MFHTDTKTQLTSPEANRYFPLHFTEAKTPVKYSIEKSHRGTQQSEFLITWRLQLVKTSSLQERDKILLEQQYAS